MLEDHPKPGLQESTRSEIEVNDGAFTVNAALLGDLLNLPASSVTALMREGAITSVCERGIDDHEGEFRLTFFYRNRRARVATDPAGRILRRSIIDFGDYSAERGRRRRTDDANSS